MAKYLVEIYGTFKTGLEIEAESIKDAEKKAREEVIEETVLDLEIDDIETYEIG